MSIFEPWFSAVAHLELKGTEQIVLMYLLLTHKNCKEYEKLNIKTLREATGITGETLRKKIQSLHDKGAIEYFPRPNDSRVRVKYSPLCEVFLGQELRMEKNEMLRFLETGQHKKENRPTPATTKNIGKQLLCTKILGNSEEQLWSTWEGYISLKQQFQTSLSIDDPLQALERLKGIKQLYIISKYIYNNSIRDNNRGYVRWLKSAAERSLTPDKGEEHLSVPRQAIILMYTSEVLFPGKAHRPRETFDALCFHLGAKTMTVEEILLAMWRAHHNKFWSGRVEKTDKRFKNVAGTLNYIVKPRDDKDPRDSLERLLELDEHELRTDRTASELYQCILRYVISNHDDYENPHHART